MSSVSITGEEADAFLRISYAGLLGRPVDMHGYRHYYEALTSGTMAPSTIIAHIISSDEFKGQARFNSEYSLSADETFNSYVTPAVQSETSAFKEAVSLPYDVFMRRVSSVVDLGSEYFIEHARRFHEMAVAVENLCRIGTAKPPYRLLDFGAAHTGSMLGAALGTERFRFFDCDIASHEWLPSFIEQQFAVHLERDEIENLELDIKFDIMLFCEVLEHLRANPVKTLRFLRNQLSESGSIFLTTPNFFRRQHIARFADRKPMQPIVGTEASYDTLHYYHVREYCANEVFQYAHQAGLVLKAFWFSSCWDDPALVGSIPEDQLANLSFVFARSR